MKVKTLGKFTTWTKEKFRILLAIYQQLEQANSFMTVVLNNPAVYLGWFGYLDKATIRTMEK